MAWCSFIANNNRAAFDALNRQDCRAIQKATHTHTDSELSEKIALNLMKNWRKKEPMMMAWRCCCCCCLLFRLSVVIFVCSRLQLRLFVVIAWMQAALFIYIFHTNICVCNACAYIFGTRPNFQLYLLCGTKIFAIWILNRSHSNVSCFPICFHLPHYIPSVDGTHRWRIHNHAYTLETKSL